MNEALTVADVARIFGVTAATVRRWDDDGVLHSTRTLGGHRRFSRTAVEERQKALRDDS